MLKYCFSYSPHRDEQNEMQQAYVWVKNNKVSTLSILTAFDTMNGQAGGQWGTPYVYNLYFLDLYTVLCQNTHQEMYCLVEN